MVKRVVWLVCILIISVVIASNFNKFYFWGDLNVTITNQSDSTLKSILVFHRCDSETIDLLKPNETRIIKIKFPGEDRIKISLGSGTKVINVYIMKEYGKRLELLIKKNSEIEWRYTVRLGLFKKRTTVGAGVDIKMNH